MTGLSSCQNVDFIRIPTVVQIQVDVPATELWLADSTSSSEHGCLAQYGLTVNVAKVINSVLK